MPKYPQRLIAGPCLHAVSDPLPVSTLESDRTIDEWFNDNFDDLFSFPPPVDVMAPDLSVQWEVELFDNYNIPQEPQKQPFKSLNSREYFCFALLYSSSRPRSLLATEDQPSTSVDLFALDDFLQSLDSGGSVAPSETMDSAITVSAADTVPQDLSLSESIDWTALLNAQTYEPALDSIFDPFHTNSLPLPEIDLSILQLP